MQEFIQHLIDKTGISQEQANMVTSAIREFVNQKAPMMVGAVDQLLGTAPAGDNATGESAANPAEDLLGGLKSKMGGFMGGF